MKNIRERLKMEFLNYNCFPTITKLIVRSINISKSRADVVVVLKDTNILMFFCL